MARGAAQDHLYLFDGTCGLCSRAVRFVLARDRGRQFAFAPLQSPLGRAVATRAGEDPDVLTTFLVVENYRRPDARIHARARAALFVAAALGWPWRAARALTPLPTRWLDAWYELVARNRYRLFGRHEYCAVPSVEDRDRFLEESGQ